MTPGRTSRAIRFEYTRRPSIPVIGRACSHHVVVPSWAHSRSIGSTVRTREPDRLPGDRLHERVGGPGLGGRFRERPPAADPAVGSHAVARERVAACGHGLHHDLVEAGQRVPAEGDARARRRHHLLDHDGHPLRNGDAAAGGIGGDPLTVRRGDRADGGQDVRGRNVQPGSRTGRRTTAGRRPRPRRRTARRRPRAGSSQRRSAPARSSVVSVSPAATFLATSAGRATAAGTAAPWLASHPSEAALAPTIETVRQPPARPEGHQRRRCDGVRPGCVGRPLGGHRRVRLAVVLAVMGEHDDGRACDRGDPGPEASHRAGLRRRSRRRR